MIMDVTPTATPVPLRRRNLRGYGLEAVQSFVKRERGREPLRHPPEEVNFGQCQGRNARTLHSKTTCV